MKATRIEAGLNQLRVAFEKILEDDASQVIEEAIIGLKSSKKLYDSRTKRTDNPRLAVNPWGYIIYPQRPLRFKASRVIKGLPMSIDIYCVIQWEKEDDMPVKQNIHLRLWSEETSCIYRPEWDAQNIQERIIESELRRVMFRCHFDLANLTQAGPKYHFQFGGNAGAEEVWWVPKIINLPRINFPPMDLILIGQLIAANFFNEDYERIKNEAEWISTVRESQRAFLKDYYQTCTSEIGHDNILLDRLWNSWQ
jgi:hypothetical protein